MIAPIIYVIQDVPESQLPHTNQMRDLLPDDKEVLNCIPEATLCSSGILEASNTADQDYVKNLFIGHPAFQVSDCKNSDFVKISTTLSDFIDYERDVVEQKREVLEIEEKALKHNVFAEVAITREDIFTDFEMRTYLDYKNDIRLYSLACFGYFKVGTDQFEYGGLSNEQSFMERIKKEVTKNDSFSFYITTAIIGDYHC